MAEPLAPKNYKVARNGVEIGEFKPFAFMQDVQSGKIRQDDWYWVQGMTEWKRVSELKILEELRESPPPPPLSRAQLDGVTRGSIVQVIDPEASVWYWVVVERCLEDRSFLGRIDANCIVAGPTLRHGGQVAFHEDNILRVWPLKIEPIFDRRWFRVASQILSSGSGVKALKRLEKRV